MPRNAKPPLGSAIRPGAGSRAAAMFLLNEGAGKTINDLCGRTVASSGGAPTWGTSRYGKYLDLSASAIFNQPLRNVGSFFTILLRTRTSSVAVVQLIAGQDSGSNNGWRVELNGASGLSLTFGGVADNNFGIAPTVNVWNWIGMTCNGNGGTANCYVLPDGGTLAKASVTVGTISGTPNRFTIGSDLFASAFSYTGQLSDVQFYSYPMTASEVFTTFANPYRMVGSNPLLSSLPGDLLARRRLAVFGA